jgi:hypothetical protein
MENKVINVEVKTDVSGVKSLKQELRETVQALQSMESGTEEFDRMTLKAAELKDRMADVNEQINVFASGSKYERVSNALGEVGSAIRNMDFEKAAERAGSFAKAASSISFADAIQSVKQLGSTFLTIGKALLTNPLFLLAAVIIGIVVAVVKLLDKLGVLKKIMDAIDQVLGVVVQGLKDFADWIGITDFAGEEAAENEKKRLADVGKQRAIAMEAFKLQQKGIIAGLDNEIAVRKAAGKDTTDLEREKFKVIKSMAEAELAVREMQARAVAALTGTNSIAYQQTMMQIEEARQGLAKAQSDIDAFEAGLTQKRVTAAKSRNEQLKKEEDTWLAELEKLRLLRLQQEQDLYTQIETLENEYYDSKLDKEQQEINAVQDKYFAVIEAARNAAEQMKATATTEDEKAAADEMIARAAALEEAQQQAISEIRDRYEQERRDKENQNRATQIEADLLAAGNDFNLRMQLLKEQAELERQTALEQKNLTEEQKYLIDQQYHEKIRKLEEETAAKRSQLVQQGLSMASSALSAIASLQQTSMNNQINAAKGNEKKQEALRKEAFEKNKKMQIGMAIINAAQGVLSAMASPFPLNIALAAVAALTGIASIAQIKSTTYQGGGSASAAPAAAAAAASASSTPSFNLFGSAGNTTQNAGTPTMENQMVVKAVVTESDITETQGKVNKYALNAEL